MNIPSISIIIPIYKIKESYLRQCINSIISQSCKNWEAILVDDGSPDNCGLICDEYAAKDERFHVIHQKNAGVAVARNNGIAISRAGWIAFVDPDDWVEKELIENILEITEDGTIAKLLDFDLQPVYMPERPQEVRLATCSADKARRLLGYKTKYSLEQGLLEMISYIKNRGPKSFTYHLPLEICSDKTPKTWTQHLF